MNLKDQLFAPAKKIDVPLLKETMQAADPVYESENYPNQDAVWTRIRANMPKAHRLHARKIFALVLVVMLALSLLGVATAYFMRDIFNFTFDAGWEKSAGSVQMSAYLLNNENLVHLELEHSNLDVLQAVYDGHELRVVYSLWWRDATEPLPNQATYAEAVPDVSCFLEDGLIYMCDWIEVNGEHIYFSDIHTVHGEKPGQALFYLQSNVIDWMGEPLDKLEIGLPVIRKDYGDPDIVIGHSTPETTFTIDIIKGDGLYFVAEQTEPVTFDYYPMRIFMGRFSPVSSVLRLEFIDVDGTYDSHSMLESNQPLEEYSFSWYDAVLCDMDFNPLGITSFEGSGPSIFDDEAKFLIYYSVTPPEKWPDRVQLVLKNEDGSLDKTRAIPFNLLPDETYAK
jgi:hypothetical protein